MRGMDVRAVRKSLNLTQAEFAERLGLSPAYIGHMENGRRHPSLQLAAKMEQLAGMSGLVAARVAEKMGHVA
jgi:transcriptional regulator with XRE-family HTH domain